MSRPKHRRCSVCNVVTARYSHTERQGPFVFKVWVRDPRHGEVLQQNGSTARCAKHSAETALPPEPARGSTLTDATGHAFLRRADGCWVCRDHDDGAIEFGWDEVVEDSVPPWTIREV